MPPKGHLLYSRYRKDQRFDCAFFIDKWYGLRLNAWNFQRLNDALYDGFPVHIYINMPDLYKRKTGKTHIELGLIPLACFKGMDYWEGLKNPKNFCMVISPERFAVTLKIFDRSTRISYAYFKKFNMSAAEAILLQFFLNAVIDPDGKPAQSLEKHGIKWNRYTQKRRKWELAKAAKQV